MKFRFQALTSVYFDAGCVAANAAEISKIGEKALIVTGGRSARASGALDDVCGVFEKLGIGWEIFDKVENNPSTETVKAGGIAAREAGAGFIVGIGGGSPLDAAKAIAVMATNDIEPAQLFTNEFRNRPLPTVAIPTTAGTGSEVTPYAVLTRHELREKASFGTKDTFPVMAFLDPRYTESQPLEVTVNTAIDALSHCIEGYLSRRSTPVSDIFAREGVRLFGSCLKALKSGNISYGDREALLYMAMLGGLVITHTGTTFMHAAGYYYTYFKGVPHGRANSYLLGEYLRFNYTHAKEKIDDIAGLLGTDGIDGIESEIKTLTGEAPALEVDEIARYAAGTAARRSTASNARPVSVSDLEDIFRKISGK